MIGRFQALGETGTFFRNDQQKRTGFVGWCPKCGAASDEGEYNTVNFRREEVFDEGCHFFVEVAAFKVLDRAGSR